MFTDNVHQAARELLTEEFYWSPTEESGPFGNDDGADAQAYFSQWRKRNPNGNPSICVSELLEQWNYPAFDLFLDDSATIHEYLVRKHPVVQVDEQQMLQVLKLANERSGSNGKKLTDEELLAIIAQNRSVDGVRYMTGTDNAVVAIGFSQFVSEGRMDAQVQRMVRSAINRELMPVLLDRWETTYRREREHQLKNMLTKLDSIPS